MGLPDELVELPLTDLVEPWILLRPVDKSLVEYLEMRDSIEAHGILNSITVRPCKRLNGKFEIIDGMYRFTCAKEIDLPTLPVIIKHGLSDEVVLSIQLQANAIKPETKPCEFATQLRRLQQAFPDISMRKLSAMVCKSPQWVRRTLGLLRLNKPVQKMVDRGEISSQNAFWLSRIPPRLRMEYIDQAKTLTGKVFAPIAASVVKQYKEAVRQGKLDAFFTEEFEPQPYLRSLTEVTAESESPIEGPLVVATENCKTPIDGWRAALKWMMHLDSESVVQQEAKARAKARKNWS
jgi:ParB/RepB/Spo0J family partition protein